MAKKVLKLVFANSHNTNKTITISNPKDGLDEATVKAAMDKIAAAKAFGLGEVVIYNSVVGAKYYTTATDNIFNIEDAKNA
ncbi:DUF2922 domain-containing protein [Lactobacillus sp. ESL0791]|uniref:DUF2922 domain-containing protein n=1 Tax=Lactobacillus sp. ESL0791 TaxID=2983234 RepID=UPI0023F6EABB|nr:DUF2922 domain-containing protein [Lactobacillus sp. ESL0791]MDF7639986.1 DUF2922 domain-containing protein [Lactobacillus sp. ESL0791]